MVVMKYISMQEIQIEFFVISDNLNKKKELDLVIFKYWTYTFICIVTSSKFIVYNLFFIPILILCQSPFIINLIKSLKWVILKTMKIVKENTNKIG